MKKKFSNKTAQDMMRRAILGSPAPIVETALDKQVGGQHYKGDKIQHFTLCMEDNIPWGESAAIKYIMRHRKKGGRQDLEKAVHYLQMCIEYYYPAEVESKAADSSQS